MAQLNARRILNREISNVINATLTENQGAFLDGVYDPALATLTLNLPIANLPIGHAALVATGVVYPNVVPVNANFFQNLTNLFPRYMIFVTYPSGPDFLTFSPQATDFGIATMTRPTVCDITYTTGDFRGMNVPINNVRVSLFPWLSRVNNRQLLAYVALPPVLKDFFIFCSIPAAQSLLTRWIGQARVNGISPLRTDYPIVAGEIVNIENPVLLLTLHDLGHMTLQLDIYPGLSDLITARRADIVANIAEVTNLILASTPAPFIIRYLDGVAAAALATPIPTINYGGNIFNNSPITTLNYMNGVVINQEVHAFSWGIVPLTLTERFGFAIPFTSRQYATVIPSNTSTIWTVGLPVMQQLFEIIFCRPFFHQQSMLNNLLEATLTEPGLRVPSTTFTDYNRASTNQFSATAFPSALNNAQINTYFNVMSAIIRAHMYCDAIKPLDKYHLIVNALITTINRVPISNKIGSITITVDGWPNYPYSIDANDNPTLYRQVNYIFGNEMNAIAYFYFRLITGTFFNNDAIRQLFCQFLVNRYKMLPLGECLSPGTHSAQYIQRLDCSIDMPFNLLRLLQLFLFFV